MRVVQWGRLGEREQRIVLGRRFIGKRGIVGLRLFGQRLEPIERFGERRRGGRQEPHRAVSWSGNTLQMAERVSELSGAEIYRIEAADPYPEDYNATADRAKQEQDDGVYPEIANPVQNWDDYDAVFLGYPIWWYQLPMIVRGFGNGHDWAGKTIVPFNSHEGSGDGGTYDDLRDMAGTTVLEGIAIRGAEVADSLDRIDEWYEGLIL